jgi:hypothetical protein
MMGRGQKLDLRVQGINRVDEQVGCRDKDLFHGLLVGKNLQCLDIAGRI